MHPKTVPQQRFTPYDFSSKQGTDKFYAVIKAAQEEAEREFLERSDYLMKDDIEAAWKVLVPNGESSVARSDLVNRLSSYMPHVDAGAVTHLVGGGGSMTSDKLMRLLWHDGEPALGCNMSNEAWGLLDPHGRGSVGLDSLLRMLTSISGFDKLDPDDMHVIRSLLEMSPESNIVREENWHQLGSWAPKLEVLTPAQRKLLANKAIAAQRAAAGPARSGAPR